MIFRFGRHLALFLMVLAMPAGSPALGAGSAGSAGSPPWGGAWRSEIRADHALAGRILEARSGAALDAASLRDRLAGARFVLLGETHDNPDAHLAQAWLLGLMIEAGRRPAVVWEMLDAGQADALAAYQDGAHADAAGLGPAVGWDESGWPDWAMYQPIAAQALAAGLPLLAGNLPLETVRGITRSGPGAILGADGLPPRALDLPFPEPLRDALAAEILRGHCGMLPKKAVPPMIEAQRARDGEMTRVMIQGAALPGTDGAVLIAGNGHVRADRGVPWVLRHLIGGADADAEVSALVVGVLEIPPDMPTAPTPADLRVSATPEDGPPPYDIVVFVPAVDDADPCETFRDQLERMRARHGDKGAGQPGATPAPNQAEIR